MIRPTSGKVLTVVIGLFAAVGLFSFVYRGEWRDALGFTPLGVVVVYLCWLLFWYPSVTVEPSGVGGCATRSAPSRSVGPPSCGSTPATRSPCSPEPRGGELAEGRPVSTPDASPAVTLTTSETRTSIAAPKPSPAARGDLDRRRAGCDHPGVDRHRCRRPGAHPDRWHVPLGVRRQQDPGGCRSRRRRGAVQLRREEDHGGDRQPGGRLRAGLLRRGQPRDRRGALGHRAAA